MVCCSFAQIMVQTGRYDCGLPLVHSGVKRVVFLRALVFILLDCLSDASELLERVVCLCLVFDIGCGEVVSLASANIHLPVSCSLTASEVAAEETASARGVQVRI